MPTIQQLVDAIGRENAHYQAMGIENTIWSIKFDDVMAPARKAIEEMSRTMLALQPALPTWEPLIHFEEEAKKIADAVKAQLPDPPLTQSMVSSLAIPDLSSFAETSAEISSHRALWPRLAEPTPSLHPQVYSSTFSVHVETRNHVEEIAKAASGQLAAYEKTERSKRWERSRSLQRHDQTQRRNQ